MSKLYFPRFLMAMLAPIFAPAHKKEFFAKAKELRSPQESERLITAAHEKRKRKAAKRLALAEGVK